MERERERTGSSNPEGIGANWRKKAILAHEMYNELWQKIEVRAIDI